MNHERSRGKRWNTEDIHWKLVGDPDWYSKVTTGPIEYYAVAVGETVLGFLWFRDADDAAGFVRLASAGDQGGNASVDWAADLRNARSRGLSPSLAVADLTSTSGSLQMGWVVPGPPREATSPAALKQLAKDL